MNSVSVMFAAALTVASVTDVSAEVITIPVGQQGDDLRHISRPTRGLRKPQVIDQFGEPDSMSAPTGEPPISQWHYGNFTVYFEHDTAIHSVLRHTPKHPVPESPGNP